MLKDIAIVIPCYNRVDTLALLLKSLSKAKYDRDVELIFSVDYSGSDTVYNFVSNFEWKFGKKTIIKHNENIGLRKNIISCGDLTSKHDAVIVLEDDLYVSPMFYEYASNACEYYWNEDRVAGISLYAYKESESHHQFYPITNGYDTYFMQWTSSWGQLWTRPQWESFKKWYDDYTGNLSNEPIPAFVKLWRESWKKYHITYLTKTDKYFVYPTVSYTTIIPSRGTHIKKIRYESPFSMPLCTGRVSDYKFPKVDDVLKYDSYFEPKELTLDLDGNTIIADLDFYGDKSENSFKHNYYITSKKIEGVDYLCSWGGQLIPFEANVIQSLDGEMFFLYKKKDFVQQRFSPGEKLKLRMNLSNKEQLLYIFYHLDETIYTDIRKKIKRVWISLPIYKYFCIKSI